MNELLRLRSVFKPARRFPAYAEPYAGATWGNLSRVAVDYALGFVADHPDYRRYHMHTLAPEEVFFQSILAGTDFTHGLVDDNLRFYNWDGTHARTLTTEDLLAMLNSEKLFARKR